jgi:hypothetical protein
MKDDEKQKLIQDFEKAISELRVLRYTSSDEDLKGFRVHLFEDEWDKLEKTVQNMKKKEDNK